MTMQLQHVDGVLQVEECDGTDRRYRLQVKPNVAGALASQVSLLKRTCETAYPLDLIEAILRVKGLAYVCDEILRDESPEYVEGSLRLDVFAYVGEEGFQGKDVLDFGCGCGASTMVLSRMLPKARIVGVELVEEFVSIGEMRKHHYRCDNVRFALSPDGESLPNGIPKSDYVILSAVHEHLLPDERSHLLPRIWENLKIGGIFFVDQTPYRWFPIETHTTHLPMINYLPRSLALRYARAFCRRVAPKETWEKLLRRGIRGGTSREILRILAKNPGKPVLLKPQRLGVSDRIDLWHRRSASARNPGLKRAMAICLKAIRLTTGITITPNLALAIQKGEPAADSTRL